MKVFISFFIVVFFYTTMIAQTTDNGIENQKFSILKIDASKEYTNGSHTSYITLNSSVDEEKASIVAEKMEGYDKISRFSFWNKLDYRKFMFTSDISLDEKRIMEILNKELQALSVKPEEDELTPTEKDKKKERIHINPSELKQLKKNRR